MSIAGGVATAFERAERVGCTALQIFVKNNSQWVGKPIPREDARAFAAERDRTGIRDVVAHASYLINLASPDDALWNRSIDALVDQLGRTATEKARAALELERVGADELAILEEIRRRADGRRRKAKAKSEAAPATETAAEPEADPEVDLEEEDLDDADLLP